MAHRARRPPLPAGPFLVVGLARSGLAAALGAARAAARRCGLRRRRGRAATRARSWRPPGSRCTRAATASSCSPASGRVVKSPGVPQEAPVVRAARERGIAVVGELEIGWRLLPNDVIAVTGSNGKTTTTELVGHIHREAGLPVAVAGNVGTALTTLRRLARPGRGGRLRGVVVPARGHASLRARGRGAAQHHARPPRPPRHVRGLPARPSSRSSPARATSAVAVAPLGARGVEDPAAAAPARAASAPARAATLADRGRARCGGAASRSWRRTRSACAAPTTSRTRWRPRAVRLARGVDPAAVARGAATFAGVAHRLEEVATRRRRPLRQRLQGHQRRLGGRRACARSPAASTRSSAVAARARTTRRSSRPSPSAAAPST